MTDWTKPFLAACELASTTLSDAAVAGAWSVPSALEGLTVGGVAAHMYSTIRRFEVALDEEVHDPVELDVASFYGHNRINGPEDLDQDWHPLLREDAERRAADGHTKVTGRFDDVVARLTGRLCEEDPDRLIPVWSVENGATPLRSYAATRVVELVVHSDDLAFSVGDHSLEVPQVAVDEVIDVFIHLARRRSGDLAVIRAFVRGERAPADAMRVL